MASAATSMVVFATPGDNGEAMPPLSEKHTVSMYFVEAAVARLDPATRARVLAAAGIAPQWLALPQARVSAVSYSALWVAVARESGDEFFGLDRRAMKPGSFALICQAVAACHDVDRAVRRMLRGLSLFLDDVHGELHVAGGEAAIVVVNRLPPGPEHRFADETFLVMVYGLLCWLAGQRVPPNRVEFGFDRPAHAAEYTAMFSPVMVFGASRTRLCFDAALLARPVTIDTATLRRFLRAAPRSVFLKFENEESWTTRLRRRLRARQAGEPWPVFEDVADELNTAPTTLRRRLEAEGSSYQEIKDRVRCDLAIHRLVHSPATVDEIGEELGFHDASAFHRAFKRWSGLQPGEYRRQRRT